MYYPYVHIRDECWIKTAALYWPKIARVVPAGYPVADSDTVRALVDELDLLVPVDPVRTAQAVAPIFLTLLERHEDALRLSYRLPPESWFSFPGPSFLPNAEPEPALGVSPGVSVNRWPNPSLAGLYWDEVSADLRDALFASNLALPRSRSDLTRQDLPRSWVTMDSRVAWAYKCAFVEEMARQGGFVPITDQPEAHLTPDGWDAERAAAALIGSKVGLGPAFPDSGLVEAVGMLAIRIVTPADLATVPVEKIIQLRRRYTAEFDHFSAEVSSTVAALQEELADITVSEARDLYVRMEVEQRFARPLDELRRAMTGLGVDTAFSAVNLKFELPAAVTLAAGGTLSGFPVLGAAAGAAFAIAGLQRSVAQQRRALLAQSPVAYLQSAERTLDPSSLPPSAN
ncbi:DUF6236 family protein [Streptomyces cyaneofuscatus]|uniref:DUF6236 family protein n=1 Tax=Streptomyces cyaneofuscatus TaxID=66883 RepID=UPI003804452A